MEARFGLNSSVHDTHQNGVGTRKLSGAFVDPSCQIGCGSQFKGDDGTRQNREIDAAKACWRKAMSLRADRPVQGVDRLPCNKPTSSPMFTNRMLTILLPCAAALISSVAPAVAAKFDGNWSMVAATTRGHCGTIEIGLAINRGRIHSTGGSFAFYPISLGGRVSASGQVQMNAVAGPRTARGTGRLGSVRGSGTWAGRGPSGLCSGIWSANRS
jgi:hypothetical protein